MTDRYTVTLCLDAYDETTWTTVEVGDLLTYLYASFNGSWPATARIYHNTVADENDVTPTNTQAVERLAELSGRFFVVVYPAELTTALYFVIAAVVVAAVVFRPTIPNVAQRNTQASAANNELVGRTNQARPNARIPDHFGTLIAVPDLVSAPYTLFDAADADIEVEHSLMCVGRGTYDIPAASVKDGETQLSTIDGASAKFYAPGTSPAAGLPFLTIGAAFSEPAYATFKSSGVIGQELLSPNSGTIVGKNNIGYTDGDTIVSYDSNIDFTDSFKVGQSLTLTNAEYGGNSLNGTYTVNTIAPNFIILTNPHLVNANWLTVPVDNTTRDVAPRFYQQFDRWVGPFVVEGPITSSMRLLANFVAPNGLYKDDGKTQYKLTISIEVGIQQIDAAGVNVGAEVFVVLALEGSTQSRKLVGKSLLSSRSGYRFKVRARRTSLSDFNFDGAVQDEIRWRDLYAQRAISTGFGDVTLVQTKTRAVPGALAVKDRKLNCLVTRKLPQRISGSTFTTTLHPTTLAADIIAHICFDPKLGNRPRNEVDYDNLYGTFQVDIPDYFGISDVSQFSYTFDNSDTSFEEMVRMVAESSFCTVYRRGNVIKVFFDREQDSSVLLFNHRNKVPRTEQRVQRFGVLSGYDGIELTYVDPDNADTITSLYFPGSSATKYRKVETVGVRSLRKAMLLGWREYQRLRYESEIVTFEALAEAEIVVAGQRIAVANNIRTGTQDGEVIAQSGLILTLSQPANLTGGSYSILLQLRDGTTQAVAITAGATPDKVVLAVAPALSLVLGEDRFVRTLYTIAKSSDLPAGAYLLQDRQHKGGMIHEVTAVNYDARYYAHDQDYAGTESLMSGLVWDDTLSWDDDSMWS